MAAEPGTAHPDALEWLIAKALCGPGRARLFRPLARKGAGKDLQEPTESDRPGSAKRLRSHTAADCLFIHEYRCENELFKN